MPAENLETLRPKLAEAKQALDAALDEACDTDVAGADVAELMQLEESLTVAREAASRVITVLRRLHSETPEEDEVQPAAHRVFIDSQGVQWDAFAVYPTRATKGRSTLPPPYDKGWLAIQCPEGIRRLTPIPEQWRECSNDEFCQLLEKAATAPKRTM
jgi:hypothetical protein